MYIGLFRKEKNRTHMTFILRLHFRNSRRKAFSFCSQSCADPRLSSGWMSSVFVLMNKRWSSRKVCCSEANEVLKMVSLRQQETVISVEKILSLNRRKTSGYFKSRPFLHFYNIKLLIQEWPTGGAVESCRYSLVSISAKSTG